jgi:Hemopexin
MICYFFSGTQYIRVTRAETGPGAIDPGYPASLQNWHWGAFGSNGIDAALYSGPKCYFFSGDQYIRVTRGSTGPGSVDPGYPSSIADWNWGEFGKGGIDAALYSGSKCYFFSGAEYIRVTRGETDLGTIDHGYPAPVSNWNWGGFGAEGIDAALYSGDKCYFFCGEQYIRVSRGDTGPGSIDAGYPAPISNWHWGQFGATGVQAALFSGMDDATCSYPASFPISTPIQDAVAYILQGAPACASCYLDTTESMWGRPGDGGVNHAQGLARTHLLSTNCVYWFLTYSEIGAQGTLSQYRYAGPMQGSHVAETDPDDDPAGVAPMAQILNVPDEHPADIVFLPDVNNADAGYVFVTLNHQALVVAVYSWEAGVLNLIGTIPFGEVLSESLGPLVGRGPEFLFLDKVGDYYYLGIAGNALGLLYRAKTLHLFPSCNPGSMNVAAFEPVPSEDIVPPSNVVPPAVAPPNAFSFPIDSGASQVKIARDSTDQWFLLGYRSDPTDAPYGGTDYIDVYPVSFSPFEIKAPVFPPQHIIFPSGGTGFSSTGTHYVDPSGRFMVSSSFRWAEDKLPDSAGYVSRVDELSSY